MKRIIRSLLSLALCLAMLAGPISACITVYADETLPGEAQGLVNLAQGAVASATYYQTTPEVCGPANAIDGDTTTRWSTFNAAQAFPQAITVDLGAVCSISQLGLIWMGAGRVYTFDVYVTEDPMIVDGKLASAAATLKAQKGNGRDSGYSEYEVVAFDEAVSGRYVTLCITGAAGSPCAVLYELAIMGQPAVAEVADIVGFREQPAAFFDVGTLMESLSLPGSVAAILEDGRVQSVSVRWHCDAYDATKPGSYTFIGTPVLTDDDAVTNTGALTVEKTVTLTAPMEDGGRVEQLLNDGWVFYKGKLSGAHKAEYNDSAFEAVTLPHTWNAEDGADGGNNYYRGVGWYRRELTWRNSYEGKRVYLYFEGVSRICNVYVNGQKAGWHEGGYTAFYVDITDYLKEGSNVIAVEADNTFHADVSPIDGDFTQWGGIYRDVTLVVTGEQHIDTSDYGANGLYMTTTDVSKDAATVTVRSVVVNDGAAQQELTLRYDLSVPADGTVTWIDDIPAEWLPFDPADMTVEGGQVVHRMEKTVTVGAGEEYTLEHSFVVENPHLWNGLSDPFRYIATLQVLCDGKVTDAVSDYIGLRDFEVDANTGAYLNGVSYNLRGVCRHQDREGMGAALTAKEHNEDFAMIYEIGANAVRLAHYPQADYFYDLCDQYGILVWAENAFVNKLGGEGSYDDPDEVRDAFMDSVRRQLKELIRQQYNHPSIVVWCIHNEVQPANAELMLPFTEELTALCHKEDPTRIVTQATANATTPTWNSDTICTNLYPGWYYGNYNQLKEYIDRFRSQALGRPVGISEYGIGANYEHHCEGYPATVCKADIVFQYEEYQSEGHEAYIRQINEMDYLWCTFVWNMFDFGADHRYEAQAYGINNKGLVSYDRTVRKDAFYVYKANWSPLPTLHLNSSRFLCRQTDSIVVKAYSNLDSVTLYVNDKKISTLTQAELAQETVFMWQDVALQAGENRVRITGSMDGVEYTDEATWYFMELTSDVFAINNETMQLLLPDTGARIEDIASAIRSNVDTELTVYDTDGLTVLKQGVLTEEMVLRVRAEHGEFWYTFIRKNIAAKGEAAATYSQSTNPAAQVCDGKLTTYWSSYGTKEYPQAIQIDLGTEQALAQLKLMFYGDNRHYTYDVYVTDDSILADWSAADALLEDLVGTGYGATGGLSLNAEYEALLLPEGTSGRYITVVIKGCDAAGVTIGALWEIEAYSTLNGAKGQSSDTEPGQPDDNPPTDEPDPTPDPTPDPDKDPDKTPEEQPGEPDKSPSTIWIVLIVVVVVLGGGAGIALVLIRKKKKA